MRTVTSQPPSFVPYPLAICAASLAVGILAARTLNLSLRVCLTCAIVCAACMVWSLMRKRQRLATCLIALMFLCAGAMLLVTERASLRRDRVRLLYDEGAVASGDPVEVTGVLEGAPEIAPESFYLTLRVEQISFKGTKRAASGRVVLMAPLRDRFVRAEYESLELRYGARVRVMTMLERAENYRNPGGASLTEYLERRDEDALGTIKSPLLVERLDDARVFLPLAWLYEWRGRLLLEINKRFSAETAGVLDAALLGNRYFLSHDTAERFRDGGTFHVLVISGLHISFIGGLLFFLARLMTKRRGWQFALSTIFLWAYALAVGAESSVVRAALMFTIVALAPVLGRRARSLNALGGAALLLLVWRPGNLFDPSFQLTFIAVLAIVALAWPVLQRLQETGAWRPSHETPQPPACPRWWRALGEALFWSERQWQREMSRSVWSCKLFKTKWAARLERYHAQRALRYAFGIVVISICVQLGLLPLLVLYFHRLSLMSFILNIGVGGLMAVSSLMALVALLLAQLSATLAAPFIYLTEMLNWLMVHSVDPFARARLASIRLPEYNGAGAFVYTLYYVPLALLAIMLARWRPLQAETKAQRQDRIRKRLTPVAACAFVSLLLVIVAHPFSAGRPDKRLRIDFLDVGQGDAALVTMPDGTTVLIDGGGRPSIRQRRRAGDEIEESFERDTRSIGDAVVSEYLWWRGLDHVDYILATHADADHIDGLNDIARNFRVRGAIIARSPASDPEYARFATTMQRFGVPIYLLGRGDAMRFGEVTGEILWPLPTTDENAPSRNNDSLVMRLRLGNRTILMTGDIEKEAEAAMASNSEDLRADVVKVAHHGSKTSSIAAFIAATRPSFAIISVGLTSPFGHPEPSVVERWRASGAKILTTGREGTITVSTNGDDLKIESFVRK